MNACMLAASIASWLLVFYAIWQLARGNGRSTEAEYLADHMSDAVHRCTLCGGGHPRSACPWGRNHKEADHAGE